MSVSPDCNFVFLEEEYPYLAQGACIAEACVYTDPHNCIMKIGLLNEEICRLICAKCNIGIDKKDNLAKIVHKLKKLFFTEEDAKTCLAIEKIAKSRNKAAHNLPRSEAAYREYTMIAEQSLCAGYEISTGYYSRFVNSEYAFPAFHLPGRQARQEARDETPRAERKIKEAGSREEARRNKRKGNMGAAGAAAAGAGLAIGTFCLLPLIGGAIGSVAGAAIGALGAGASATSTAATLAAKAAGKGILSDSVNGFFGSLDLSGIDAE